MKTPEPEVPEDLLERMSGYVSAHLGLDFSGTRRRDLLRGLLGACRELNQRGGAFDPQTCLEELLNTAPPSRAQMEALAAHLTVGETYFFRTRGFFEMLESAVLPRLAERAARERRGLRLWSAGCSSGEEAWSLAILLDRMDLLNRRTKDEGAETDRPVLGTDINPLSLARAALATYSEWSFRDVPAWLKQEYFRPAGKNRFTILPRIREAVRFETLNLARDSYPDAGRGTARLDLILCRHVLMYFRKPAADEAVRRLKLCLREGGCLIVSPTEIAHLDLSEFRAERIGDTIVHWNEKVAAPVAQGRAAGTRAPAAGRLPVSAAPPPFPPDRFEETEGRKTRGPGVPPVKQVPAGAVNAGNPVMPDPAVRQIQRSRVGRPSHGPGASSDSQTALPSPPLPPSPAHPPEQDVQTARSSSGSSERLAQARERFDRGEYAEAVRVLEAVAPGVEEELECCLLGARAWANLGHPEEALAWSRRAVERSRMNSEAHYLTATLLLELGETAEAAEALRRVLYLAPDFAPAQLALARVAELSGNRREAGRMVRRMLEGLALRRAEEMVPGSEGLTVGSLRRFGEAMLEHDPGQRRSRRTQKRARRTR